MPSPNKLNVVRKISDKNLNLFVSGTLSNKPDNVVGIASTTVSSGDICLVGSKSLRTNTIGASVAIQAYGSQPGGGASGRHDSGEGHAETFYPGGTGNGGGNFLISCLSNFDVGNGCWGVSAASTATTLKNQNSNSNWFLLASSPPSATSAHINGPHAPHTHHHGSPGSNAPGVLSPLACTYAARGNAGTCDDIFTSFTCTAGNLVGSGNCSGYTLSPSNDKLVPAACICGGRGATSCPGWVHVSVNSTSSR